MEMYDRKKAVNHSQKWSEVAADGSDYLPDENIKKRNLIQGGFREICFPEFLGGRRNFFRNSFWFFISGGKKLQGKAERCKKQKAEKLCLPKVGWVCGN